MNGFQTNFPNQFNNNFNGQNGMNQMGMNQMGMNQMGTNQMGMNQMGMNQMGNNQMGMNQMGNNQMGMNQMGNNQMAMNQMIMNQMLLNQMGMNPMGFNQMGMGGQMNYNDMAKLIQMNTQNFNNANNIDFNQDNSNGISVTFERSDPEQGQLKISIQCLYTEKIKDVIQKYRIKSWDTNLLERFVFNTKNLCPTLTVAEQGLINNSKIKVIDIRDMEGGYIK